MQVINLYKYTRENGGVTVSPNKPDGEYTEMYRLIADDGKTLTNGEVVTPCIDVEYVDGWEEIDDATDEATEQDYLNALNELGVQTDEESNA